MSTVLLGDAVTPRYRLYSQVQVAGATPLGGPLAGAWLLASDYRRLGRISNATTAALLGLAGQIAAIWLWTALDDTLPPFILVSIYTIAIGLIAQVSLDADFTAHVVSGGHREHNLKAAGIGALGFLMLFAGVVDISALMRDKVHMGNRQVVYYQDGASKEEARTVGQTLKKHGYYFGEGPGSVIVSRSSEHYHVAFVVADWVFDRTDEIDKIRAWAATLSKEAFGGKPVDISLNDDIDSTRRHLRWSPPDQLQ